MHLLPKQLIKRLLVPTLTAMAATAHTLSSSEDSEDDFSVVPDLATRLKARFEPETNTLRGGHQTASGQPRTASFNAFRKPQSNGATEEVEIISSDDEEEEGKGRDGKENEDMERVKRTGAVGYDTTDEEDQLPDVLPAPPFNAFYADSDTASDTDPMRYGLEQQQASLGQRRPSANKRHQPALTAPVFGRAAVQSSLAPSQNVHSPSPPPLSKAEAKRKEAEKRKREREQLKKERLQEKERAKEMKELEKVAKKANSLAECTKWVAVRASARLDSSPAGSQLAGLVSASDLQWRLLAEPILDEAVTFARVDPRSRQETLEDLAIVILDSAPFIELVRNQQYQSDGHGLAHSRPKEVLGYTLSGLTVVSNSLAVPESSCYNSTLEEQCNNWKELLAVENLILFVWGLDEHFKNKKGNKGGGRGNKSKGNDDRPDPNRLDVETALSSVQIMQRVDHRLFSDAIQLAEYVVHLARAIAQAPYKREQLDDGAMFSSWYAEGSNVATVKVTTSGVGLRKLWQQQLRQFTSVGLETAQAIADAYPSPRLLLEAYEGLSPDEGSRLLADIPVRRGAGPLQTTRRLGPELSKKVHTFFTSTNPDRVLGSYHKLSSVNCTEML